MPLEAVDAGSCHCQDGGHYDGNRAHCLPVPSSVPSSFVKITRFTRACSRDTADAAGRCQMTVVQLFQSGSSCTRPPSLLLCHRERGRWTCPENGPGTAGRAAQRSLVRLSAGSRTGHIFWVRWGRRRRKHLAPYERCRVSSKSPIISWRLFLELSNGPSSRK